MDQMVNLFGSEKQKRAFSAAKRNLVDEGELDAALATAVSHVKKEVEGVASGMTYIEANGLGLKVILVYQTQSQSPCSALDLCRLITQLQNFHRMSTTLKTVS